MMSVGDDKHDENHIFSCLVPREKYQKKIFKRYSEMTDKTGVKLEERIVYAYGGKGGDVLKNEIKMEGSFVFRTKMEVPPAPPKLGPAASTYVIF